MATIPLLSIKLLIVKKHVDFASGLCKAGMKQFCVHVPFRDIINTEDNQEVTENGNSCNEIKTNLSTNELENTGPSTVCQNADELLRDWVGEGRLSPPHSVAYSKKIQRLCNEGEVDKAHTLLTAMVENNGNLKPHYFNSVIVAYAKAGRCNEALKVSASMRRYGFRPHQTTYHTLMSNYLKQGKALEALDMFDRMRQDGWCPNEVTRSIVAYGLCRTGHTEQVRALFQQRFGKSGTLSTSVCNALLESFFRAGNVEAAEDLGRRIFSGLCFPNVYTYATIIRGRCAQGKVDEARKLLLEMEKKGCKPILACYGSLIARLCKLDRNRDAFDLFEEMLDKGIDAEGAFCGSLLKQLSMKGMIDEALRVCKYVVDKHIFVEDATFVLLLEGLSKADRLGKAKPLLQNLMEKGCLSNARHFQQALHVLQRRETLCSHCSPLTEQDSTTLPKDV